MLGDNHLSSGLFMRHFGDAVVSNGQTTKGLFESTNTNDGFGDLTISAPKYRLLIVTSSLSALPQSGDGIQVNAVSYAVREVNPVEDGAITEILLKKR